MVLAEDKLFHAKRLLAAFIRFTKTPLLPVTQSVLYLVNATSRASNPSCSCRVFKDSVNSCIAVDTISRYHVLQGWIVEFTLPF
jgi:hypothetical protein